MRRAMLCAEKTQARTDQAGQCRIQKEPRVCDVQATRTKCEGPGGTPSNQGGPEGIAATGGQQGDVSDFPGTCKRESVGPVSTGFPRGVSTPEISLSPR